MLIEEKWRSFWLEANLFSAVNHAAAATFSLFSPPLTVNGSLDLGQATVLCLQDIIVRRKKMQGFDVCWQPSFDYSGLACQQFLAMNRKDGQGNNDKEEIEREQFLAKLNEWQQRLQGQIIEEMKSLGLSLNWTRLISANSAEKQQVLQRDCIGEVLIQERIRVKADWIGGLEQYRKGLPDIVRKYSADALRFTMAQQAVPGKDMSLALQKIQGSRFFANKIWNAARYVLLNMTGEEDLPPDPAGLADTDKWILHGLNQTVEALNEWLDGYRSHRAADRLYHFFWDEYCSWYLEFSKSDLARLDTRKVLKLTLFRLLQLLHPFMPFLSEEIQHKLPGANQFLIQTEFPRLQREHMFPREYALVELLKRLIRETRRIIGRQSRAALKRVVVYLQGDEQREREALARYLTYFTALTGSRRVEIVDDFSALGKGCQGECLNWQILVVFAREDDRLAELQWLVQEKDKVLAELAVLERMLADDGFALRAPAELVRRCKRDFHVVLDKLTKIEKTIAELS